MIWEDWDWKGVLEWGQGIMLEIWAGAAGFAETGLTLSAGIAAIEPGIGMEELVSRADSALCAAKAAGKNQCMAYQNDSEDTVTIRTESEWYSRIKEAIQLQRFQMYYQSVVELSTGKLYCP